MAAAIYLDHNATTPLLPEVLEVMIATLRDTFGNPSSGHAPGRAAREVVARAREQVAELLGCAEDEIVFTSGGTEANNLAIRGVCEAVTDRRGVVTTVIEHPATSRPCAWLEARGLRVTRATVDAAGVVRLEEIVGGIDERTALVTVMHANNETGVMQPVAAIAERARAVGAIVHTDAAQSVGKVPTRVDDLGVDLLSVAGHKLYAPKGVGALYVRRGTPLAPLLLGAGHERGVRPGTENVASIAGLGVACAIAARDLASLAERLRRLRGDLAARLAAAVPGLVVHGADADRLPNTLHLRFPSAAGDAVLAGAPEIAASTGSACHDGHASASAVILAMGVDPVEALGSVRLTLGRSTTEDEVERAAIALARGWQRARSG